MSSAQTARKKILIIDDEEHLVRYLETLLQDHGYDTVCAANGNEGLARARETRPDLVCLDITMPEKSGIRFYRELKEDPQTAATPVVVVTAVTGYGGDPRPFQEFLGKRRQVPPPEEFISKPIERKSFLETVARILAAQQPGLKAGSDR